MTATLVTAIKIYSEAYFDDNFILSELENIATQAVQFGETSSFTGNVSEKSKMSVLNT